MIESIYLLVDKSGEVYPTVFKRLRDAKGRRTAMMNYTYGKKREWKIMQGSLQNWEEVSCETF